MGNDLSIADVHAHVLPGLDDGPRTMRGALRLCQLLADEGVSTVVATPHMCWRRFAVTAAQVRRGIAELSEACRRHGLHIRVLPGSEARVQPELLEALDAGELVTVADAGRYLLLEFHPQSVAPIGRLVFELGLRGVRPILCHPERQRQLWRDPGRLARMVEQGCLVQVTALSLLGGHGSVVRRVAEGWLRNGLVHVVASDAHSATRRPPWMQRAAERLVALGGADLARRLLDTNPSRIIRGEEVDETPATRRRPAEQALSAQGSELHPARASSYGA